MVTHDTNFFNLIFLTSYSSLCAIIKALTKKGRYADINFSYQFIGNNKYKKYE